LLGNDFEATALGFRLEHEPGGFFNVSPVNSQLAAIIVERAVGAGFEDYLDQRVVGPAALSMFELQLDRASGMPAAYCCLRATARDVLRIADLLLHDGERREAGSARVLPGNWLTEMRKGSRANPAFGLQIERLDRTPETWQLGGGMGGVAWLVPSDDLAIVMLAHRDVSVAADVLEMLRGSVRK
jgi:CubicO group peptidase (beta-lactamase class C family)